MTVLERKLARDLWRLKGQVATIALVLACGVMSIIMMRSTWLSLIEARDRYYDEYRFGDVFAHLERAPDRVAGRLEVIPGVAAVYPRIARDVMVPLDDMPEPVTGRLISLPEAGATAMNALYVRTGRLPDPGETDEVTILEAFALAHGLAPGDRLPVVIAGKLRSLTITGIALSPEFVFATSGHEVIPDSRSFVVAWMPRAAIARAFDMDGAFDDVVLRLAPGASLPAVLDAVDRELARYGGRHAVGRDKQTSNHELATRLDLLRNLAMMIPAVFLMVSAFLVNVVVSRLVFLERTQIAVLKALGLSNARIARHYLALVALVVALAAVVGFAGGWWSGRWMSDLYAAFYSFPRRTFHVSFGLIAFSVGVGLAAAIGGALGAVRKVARLPPAEAMRPPAPLTYRRSWLERVGLGSWFGPSATMVFREIRRRPLRFAMSSAGIAMGIGIFILGRFSNESFDRLMLEVFPREQQQDLTVLFDRALPDRALRELEHLPGVWRAEGQRVVAARIRAATRWRDTAITGIPADAALRTLFDAGTRPVALPDAGLVMCDRLADALGVAVGDEVDVELMDGDFATRRMPVARLIDEAFGLPVYARADWLARQLREQPRSSLALLRVDPARQDEVAARLKRLPHVLSVTSLDRVIERYRQQIGSSMLVMTLILTISAAAIAIGVVYNNARIALSMRGRDLATLRVLGFTRREISNILLGELGAQVAAGVVLGMFVGQWWAQLLARTFPSELYHLPVYIAPHTYVLAAVIAVASGLFSALLVRRKLDRLDLIAVLKSSE